MADDPYDDDRDDDDEGVGDNYDGGVGDDYDDADVAGTQYREDETYDYGDDEVVEDEDTEDDSWWDEGLITLLLVAGLALFLFPEPATSGLGIALLAVGAVLWLFDWFA